MFRFTGCHPDKNLEGDPEKTEKVSYFNQLFRTQL